MSDVLLLTRQLPYPPNAGDRIVTFGFVRALAALGHDVHLLSYGRPDDGAAIDVLAEHCESIARVDGDQSTRVASVLPSSALPTPAVKAIRWARRRSHVMAMFDSPAFRRATAERIRDVAPDIVLAEHPYMGQPFLDDGVQRALAAVDATPVVNAHVVEFRAHQRQREYADDWRTRLALSLEIPALMGEELQVYDAAERTLVLGDEDANVLEGRVSGPVVSQRVALDVDEYESAPGVGTADTIVFFGSYNWFPNEDAVLTFCDRVLPALRERRPNLEFLVAGRDATPEIRALGERPGVTVVGEVDDLAGLVRDVAVVVAPLRIGGGVRLKVLESMAWGAPVVTTPAGAEGVAATPGEDIVVADDWGAFAAETARLLGDRAERRRMGERARQTVERRYDRRAVAPELAENLGLEPSGRVPHGFE